jgi:hypothetical protein
VLVGTAAQVFETEDRRGRQNAVAAMLHNVTESPDSLITLYWYHLSSTLTRDEEGFLANQDQRRDSSSLP